MVLHNLLLALAKVSDIVLNILLLLIFLRAIISWVNPDPFNPIVQFLYRVTEPVLSPIRSRMPYTPIDLSPIIVWLLIVFLKMFLVNTLYDWAFMVR